jgi:hypothetical protein
VLKEFVECGKFKPLVDRTFPLRETPAVLGHI